MMREKLEALADEWDENYDPYVMMDPTSHLHAEAIRAILAAEPEPGLREEDLRRLAIYSVATCDINGGNKRDCPAILLEQAIAALARTPPQKPPCPYYCEPSHVVGEKCACPCHAKKPKEAI